MTSKIWIKLYIEILEDPKMGRLTNHLWRRAIELFLLAGKDGNDGALPPVEEMEWILRLSKDKLLEDLHNLAEAGVVQQTEPTKWMVTNFAKRQAAVPAAERMRKQRSRDGPVTIQNSSCYDYVTNRNKTCYESGGGDSSSSSSSESFSDSESFNDSFSDSESLKNKRAHSKEKCRTGEEKTPVPTGLIQAPINIFQAYEQNIGAITPMIAEALQDAEKSDGAEWIIAAIKEAVQNNARSWKYIEAILQRWRRDGFRVDTKNSINHRKNDGKLTPEQLATWVKDRQKVET
jgi:DnaD/phage-associated family protein